MSLTSLTHVCSTGASSCFVCGHSCLIFKWAVTCYRKLGTSELQQISCSGAQVAQL